MLKKLYLFVLLPCLGLSAQTNYFESDVNAIESKVIEWRRDFHQHPELGNQEFRTSEVVAKHLESLGIEVKRNVAITGVVGVLKGAKPGPVIALRADMDGLPVTERVDVPFKSEVKVEYADQTTGVMHACGHDSHMAILMATAEILAKHKNELAGTVKFIFQPAEEGVFGEGKAFGADLMVQEGALKNPDVDVAFGLHINSQTPAGQIKYKSGPVMAAVDQFYITVRGKQTHGAYPWSGVDPILVSSQIILGLNTIVSRNVNLIENPAVVSVGAINAGNRHNIIPEEAKFLGTIRTFDLEQRALIHKRIKEIAENIAKSAGAVAEVSIENGYPVTFNNVALTKKMLPSLQTAAGPGNTKEVNAVMGAEDFSYFAREVPGLFFFLGAMEKGKSPSEVAPHHTPDFYLDESGFKVGVQAFCNLVLDYMKME
ncbi:amidohydrolase [uncultured Arcticibacterium sp.]|uniref:amidohydrolase n=1 Tax=uncultured Arcticibacterium sp. TaxID=2173042 RepID=UPI0030F53970